MIDKATYKTYVQRIKDIDTLIETKRQELSDLYKERTQKLFGCQELEKNVIDTNLNSEN